MKLFQHKLGGVHKNATLFLAGLLVLLFNTAQGQFTITENFKGQVGADIIVGGDATLTSGNGDPVAAGWLRLTPGGVANQRGYAYVNRTFPSTMGVVIDFEYKLWRKVNNNEFTAGDGFSVFLFDGTFGPSNFNPGGYGGSLIYAPLRGGNPDYIPGLTGGYIGLGFDSFGNYGAPVEGHNGSIEPDGNNSSTSYRPNSIILRGPTTSDESTTNRYLSGKKLGTRYADANATRDQSEVHYAPLIQQRPTDARFYRRVQIEINPVVIGQSYRITARWAKSPTGPFEPLFESVTNDIPPALLKLGFGAATGGARQYHEIRNLVVTTPGNLRVSKMADKDILRTKADNGANKITYTVEVNNDTDADLTNIDFKDRITDGAGDLVPTNMFTITSISNSGFLEGTTLPTSSNTNEFSGKLNIKAKTVGRITVTGILKMIPIGNSLINTATALPTDISDQDLENNSSIVKTPVIAEGIDLIASKNVDDACLNTSTGNTFTVNLANMGSGSVSYGGISVSGDGKLKRTYTANRLEVTEVIPPGVTILSSTIPDGWDPMEPKVNTPTVGYTTYIYQTKVAKPKSTGNATVSDSETLLSGGTLPAFTFKLKGGSSYTNQVKVRLIQESGELSRDRNNDPWKVVPTSTTAEAKDLEPRENWDNNSASASVLIRPSVPPTLAKSIIYYCQGEIAKPLEATATASNFKIVWYSSNEGVPLNNVPTPVTTNVGPISYFVSQTNGSCESTKGEVKVIVLAPPTPGAISGDQELCRGTVPNKILSKEIGTAPNWPEGTKITYRWERLSPIAGTNWDIIVGATGAEYTPIDVSTVGVWKYRRVTIPDFAEKKPACEAISDEVSITVKNCMIISNPILRSRARK